MGINIGSTGPLLLDGPLSALPSWAVRSLPWAAVKKPPAELLKRSSTATRWSTRAVVLQGGHSAGRHRPEVLGDGFSLLTTPSDCAWLRRSLAHFHRQLVSWAMKSWRLRVPTNNFGHSTGVVWCLQDLRGRLDSPTTWIDSSSSSFWKTPFSSGHDR